MLNKNYFFYAYLVNFIFLSLPVVKLFGLPQAGQVFFIATFIFIVIDDIKKKELDYLLLFFLIIGGTILSLLSLNSIYERVGEFKFIIKYILVFPAIFYVGARAVFKIGVKNLIIMFDIVLLFYVLDCYIIYFVPLPPVILDSIVHYREVFGGALILPFQGTFFETGSLALIVGASLLSVIMLRYDFKVWPQKKLYIYTLYGLTVTILMMSRNKTVWLSYVLILLFLSVYKALLLLLKSNFYYTQKRLKQDYILSKFIKIKSFSLISISIVVVLAFFIVNSTLDKPLISQEILKDKIENERGAQYAAAWNLIAESNYYGGYGFGFVESYFANSNILGVGEGSSSINNIFLDMWLQGSIFALLYLLILFFISSSNKIFLTILLPLYFFIFGLTNPIISSDFFIFMGLSYGFARYVNQKKEPYRGTKYKTL